MKRALVILFIFVVGFVNSFSQRRVVENLQQSDNKLIHFGFTLGMHTQDFMFKPSEVPDEDGTLWYGDVASPSPGFTVGIISDLRLGNYFNLRFVPTLNFGERKIAFAGFQNGVKIEQFDTSVLSTLIAVPFYVKYRALRLQNYRPYLIAGGGGMIDLSRKKDEAILLKQFDLFVEFGVGCDFYLPYFKLAPEFKMCLGFNNLIERDRPLIQNEQDLKYSNSIESLTSRLFILTFNFE